MQIFVILAKIILTFLYNDEMEQSSPISKPVSTPVRLLNILIASGRTDSPEAGTQARPVSLLRWQLFFTSFCLLFFELACIRWIPSHVRYLGYFLNFILLASFLGIGAGIMTSRKQRLWLPPFPVLFFVLCAVVGLNWLDLRIPSTQVLYYGASEGLAQTENYLALPLIFILVAATFLPLARRLGNYLAVLPPLQAYAFDILGSLAGIAAFFIMSYFSLPPLIWFGILFIVYLPISWRREWILSAPLLVGAFVILAWMGEGSYWSPYYRITVTPNDIGGYIVNVNNVGHQETMPSSQRESFYFRAYDLLPKQPFKKVLILGAGTGSDVSIALQNGAERVDAVEIDPLIYTLGKTLHPEHPYADPRVHVIIDDGRAYLRNTSENYDLVVFALPDSLVLTSGFSSLRLESFLLTKEAIEAARARLNPDGLVVLYNYYREDWLVDKLAGLSEQVFHQPPFVTTYGDWGRAAVIINGPRLAEMDPVLMQPYTTNPVNVPQGRGWQLPVIGEGLLKGDPNLEPAVDDWPFIYMPARAIPGAYLAALGMVLVIALAFVGLAAPRSTLRRFNWHFFLLGAAFMLLETRSLVTFSLLFGSTWMVNSLVFFAILASVLLAILFNSRYKVKRVWLLFGLLFAALLVNYLIPQRLLLDIPAPALRYGLASLLTFLPIFLANIVFSHSFRDTESADIAFGSNLLGAMAGGLCEYFALITGYQALLLVALAFYALAWLVHQRSEKVTVSL
jgi:SAM-dependent methyltransferase